MFQFMLLLHVNHYEEWMSNFGVPLSALSYLSKEYTQGYPAYLIEDFYSVFIVSSTDKTVKLLVNCANLQNWHKSSSALLDIQYSKPGMFILDIVHFLL